MARSKTRPKQHQIDERGQELFRRCLPNHWALREYKPDYGIDYDLEIFRLKNHENNLSANAETLGEHVFIQLKTVTDGVVKGANMYSRSNVEKSEEYLNKEEIISEVSTYRKTVEMEDLITVERMGVGLPLLLVIADLKRETCSFVCVNDYIDKIFMPRFEDYRLTDSRTVHVPATNYVNTDYGTDAIRWYGKRSKMFAAFHRFRFQNDSLKMCNDLFTFHCRARYFAKRIINYDFWDDVEMWKIVNECYQNLYKINEFYDSKDLNKIINCLVEREELNWRDFILMTWRMLASMPNIYEDICREWFLPTPLGDLSS